MVQSSSLTWVSALSDDLELRVTLAPEAEGFLAREGDDSSRIEANLHGLVCAHWLGEDRDFFLTWHLVYGVGECVWNLPLQIIAYNIFMSI